LKILFKMSPTAVNVLVQSAQLPEAGVFSYTRAVFFSAQLEPFCP
jgi:hypothetical protein